MLLEVMTELVLELSSVGSDIQMDGALWSERLEDRQNAVQNVHSKSSSSYDRTTTVFCKEWRKIPRRV